MLRTTSLFCCLTHAALVFVASSAAGAESSPFTFDLYGRVGDFTWEETAEGVPILEESGILYTGGGRVQIAATDAIWIEGLGELFLGQVDYDGALQDLRDGSLTPYTSETDYIGMLLAFHLGLQHTLAERVSVSPYAGLGIRFWRRSIGADTPYGYDEDWSTTYGALGCVARAPLSSNASLFARGELRLALENNVRVAVAFEDATFDVDLEPDTETTVYLEGGAEFHHLVLSIYYETYRFGRSSENRMFGLFQPRSSGDMVGIRAGVTF